MVGGRKKEGKGREGKGREGKGVKEVTLHNKSQGNLNQNPN